MVLARSWALTAASAFLATWLGRTEPAVRQQWRESTHLVDLLWEKLTQCSLLGNGHPLRWRATL